MLDHLNTFQTRRSLQSLRSTSICTFYRIQKPFLLPETAMVRVSTDASTMTLLKNYELSEETPHIYRNAAMKNGNEVPSSALLAWLRPFESLQMSSHNSTTKDINKTLVAVAQRYHGKTEKNVRVFLGECAICLLSICNKTKPFTPLIISKRLHGAKSERAEPRQKKKKKKKKKRLRRMVRRPREVRLMWR